MDVEALINKKKEEIIEEVKQETEGLHASITDKAVEKLEQFAAELKMAIDMHPIGAADLLKVIEEGGLVYQRVVDVTQDLGYSSADIGVLLRQLRIDPRDSKSFIGKQRVTIIIEPIGGGL